MSYRVPDQPFIPHPLIRNPSLQTLLSRHRPKEIGWIQSHEVPILIDAGVDATGYDKRSVRMLGYYTSSVKEGMSRGLILTIHGWQGCSHSVYNMLLTDRLVRAGFDVFRLNFRDHGPAIHLDPYTLNTGLFMGTLLDEAITAVGKVAEMANKRPFYIVGASMGGNFALRLAVHHKTEPFANLRHIIAISPALSPARAVDVMDAQPVYRHYFRKRWLESLHAKQVYFPKYFNFAGLEQISTVREMTEWFIERYSDYGSADEYFHNYGVDRNALQNLTVRTTIITAFDDPLIPVLDFYTLAPHPLLDMYVQPHGGHVGFMEGFPLRHCLPQMVLEVLEGSQVVN